MANKNKSNHLERLFTDKEAAEYLRVSQVTLWRERKKGNISYRRFGTGKIMYTQQDLQDYLNASVAAN